MLSGLGWDFWALVALFVVAIGWGLTSLIQPREDERLPAILGYREGPRPTPTPAPQP